MNFEEILFPIATECGFFKVGLVSVNKITFDRAFRKACEANACGNYGKCWTCPPDAGNIDELIERAKAFEWAVVYQSVGVLEDSYDIEGMTAAGSLHNQMAQKFIEQTKTLWAGEVLHLASGGCRLCERCAKRDNLPCRHPDFALSSLETYGVAVSQLAGLAGMKYINGVDTVTYFSASFFRSLKD